MKKYSLTSNKIEVLGTTLFQIKAEMSFGSVSKGDLGGYIEKESNLSMEGNAWVYGNAQVSGDARVYGNARVYGDSICKVLSPINIVGMHWNITLTDNNIHIGCKTFQLKKALSLASRWKTTSLKYDEAKLIESEKKLLVEVIRLRLFQLENEKYKGVKQ